MKTVLTTLHHGKYTDTITTWSMQMKEFWEHRRWTRRKQLLSRLSQQTGETTPHSITMAFTRRIPFQKATSLATQTKWLTRVHLCVTHSCLNNTQGENVAAHKAGGIWPRRLWHTATFSRDAATRSADGQPQCSLHRLEDGPVATSWSQHPGSLTPSL